MRMGLPSWTAVTWRVPNDRPSRVRTTSKVIGSSSRPARMK